MNLGEGGVVSQLEDPSPGGGGGMVCAIFTAAESTILGQ